MRVLGSQLAVASVLVAVAVTSAQAQRRPAPTTATKASASAPQGKDNGGAKTKFTLFAGLATGDNYDMGIALQGSFKIEQSGWPVAVRIDPYVARHGGNYGYATSSTDVTLTMLGVAGNVEYTFKTSGSTSVEPYVLGGVGIYHGSVDITNDVVGFNYGGSDTNLGIGIGGGIRFAKRWALEAQFRTINNFDTIPILVGFHF